VCGVQFSPPSVVLRIKPPSPTAVPVLASVGETLKRQIVPGFAWFIQVPPPSVVLRMVLSPPIPHDPPTAVPVFASIKETPNNIFAVPLDCGTQLFPPSVVLRIVPLSPVAAPLFAS